MPTLPMRTDFAGKNQTTNYCTAIEVRKHMRCMCLECKKNHTMSQRQLLMRAILNTQHRRQFMKQVLTAEFIRDNVDQWAAGRKP